MSRAEDSSLLQNIQTGQTKMAMIFLEGSHEVQETGKYQFEITGKCRELFTGAPEIGDGSKRQIR
jgi:hypothetical protein